jgi:GMP synthase (glutamine-hydrolysing)
MFRDNYNLNLIHADEKDLFLGALEGVSDPEVKRKTIGRLFIDVFQKYANQNNLLQSFQSELSY